MVIIKFYTLDLQYTYQSLLVKSIPSKMFSSVSCRPLVYTTTMYRTRSDHALSSRTACTGYREFTSKCLLLFLLLPKNCQAHNFFYYLMEISFGKQKFTFK